MTRLDSPLLALLLIPLIPLIAIGVACKPSTPGESDTEAESATETTGEATSAGPTSSSDSEPTGGTGDPSDGSTSHADVTTETDTGPLPSGSALDILFVIDNSGTMGAAQSRLAASAPAIIAALEGAELRYRIAVTTTDVGNPRCNPGSFPRPPNAGRFDIRSCREHIEDFAWEPLMIEESAACTDLCAHDSLGVTPTMIQEELGEAPRAWIESDDGVANVDIPVAEALTCLLPQGVNGCGFEAPLEAAYLALQRATTPDEENYGFLRREADLLVVLVTDEVDCSYVPNQDSIFVDPDPNWSWEPGASSATSAVCWNAGVQCDGDEPGPYTSCYAVNRDLFGDVGAGPALSVLHHLDRYSEQLQTIIGDKQQYGASVHFTALAGVPEGYADGQSEIAYLDDPDPAQQISFGIGPGCVDGLGGRGLPPVRIRELHDAVGGPQLDSICLASYDGAFTKMLGEVISGL